MVIFPFRFQRVRQLLVRAADAFRRPGGRSASLPALDRRPHRHRHGVECRDFMKLRYVIRQQQYSGSFRLEFHQLMDAFHQRIDGPLFAADQFFS